MAFVMNMSDPSGLGMFSKAGRFATEKHIVFQKKDEILTDKRKYLRVSSMPNLKYKQDAVANKDQDNPEEVKTKPQMQTTITVRPQVEIMSKTLGREERERVLGNKNPPPPVGCYNPRYALQKQRPIVLAAYPKERPKTAQSFRNRLKTDYIQWSKEEVLQREMTKPIVDKAERKVKGSIKLASQTARDRFYRGTINPHEERFKYVAIPRVSTKFRRVSTPDLSKSRGRNKNNFSQNLGRSPDYVPDFEFGRKQLGSCGPKFEKLSPRKPFHFVSESKNDNFLDAEKVFKSEKSPFFERVPTPVIDRSIPREKDPKTPFPTFMQYSIASRISVGMLSQKALKINNFAEGRFQTVYSSFTPQKFT